MNIEGVICVYHTFRLDVQVILSAVQVPMFVVVQMKRPRVPSAAWGQKVTDFR
jgi:hypothetical protein